MRINPELTLRKVAGEYMIINTELGKEENISVFSLNEIAAYIWRSLENKTEFSIGDILAIIESEYEINDYNLVQQDIKELIEEWKENGFVTD